MLEETPSTVYLVLPTPGAAVGTELSEAQLDAVAGGGGGWTSDTEACDSCHATCGCIT